MHPIFRDRARLALYLAGWLAVGCLLALALTGAVWESWRIAALLVLPLSLVYSFVCLAAWYPCRANPIGEIGWTRLASVHLAGAVFSSAAWQALAWGWARTLDRSLVGAGAAELHRQHLPMFFLTGALLYLLSVTVHYLVLAGEASRRAERRELELGVLAREAELEAFKAQIDPHFLFNSLNSISSLCGSDPAAARSLAIRLGEFFRASLELGAGDAIRLSRELELAAAYLEVERARYGDRLLFEEEIDPACLDRKVPALILQPLLENALKHGVAHLVEGGRVLLRGEVAGRRLHLAVENACDPDRPRQTGAGIGLANVRGRLQLQFGDDARLSVRDLGNSYRVEIVVPEEPRLP